MTTRQLHQAVSRATGEDVDLIAHRGFTLAAREIVSMKSPCEMRMEMERNCDRQVR